MKAKDLIAKLNKLVEINQDANVYFYADDESIQFIGGRYLNGSRLSDIGLALSRTYENGEGLISIDIENRNIDIEKKNKCGHETVLEIYKDDTHEEVSHYRCAQCGDMRNVPFGKNVVKSDGKNIHTTF